MRRFLILISGLFILAGIYTSPVLASTYYVATNGDDSWSGTYPEPQGEPPTDGPWLTIQHAANTVAAGDTVYIRGGTYFETGVIIPTNSGNAVDGHISFQNYQDETVTLDGTVAKGIDPETRIFDLAGKSYIKIIGLRVVNYIYGVNIDSPAGLPAHHIEIRHCYIDIGDPSYMSSGRGLAIHLRNAHDFIIADLEIYDCKNGILMRGSQAGETYNGQVLDVYSHDHWGNEGDGVVVGDGGHDIMISGCEAHSTQDDGIDVRGYNITVKHCICYDNNSDVDAHGFKFYGIDKSGGEDPGTHIRAERCLSYNNYRGIFCSGLGIYNFSTGTRNENYRSKKIEAINCTVANNDYGVVLENTYDAYPLNPYSYNTIASGSDTSRALTYYQSDSVLTSDYNLWWTQQPGLAPIDMAGIYYSTSQIENPYTPGSWYDDTGNGEYSRSVNPLFVDENANDFHLQVGSPCIDSGIDLGFPYVGSAPDMGFYESGAVSIDSPTDYLKAGENWISIPVAATNPGPYSVFADLGYWPNCVYHNLYRYDTETGNYVKYPTYQSDAVEFGKIIPGGAYKLMLATDELPITVTGVELKATQTLTMPCAGRHYIGNPFNKPVYWQSCQIDNGGTVVSVAEAEANGWIGDVEHFTPSGQTWEAIGSLLEPWHAYRLQVYTAGALDLIIPYPYDVSGTVTFLYPGWVQDTAPIVYQVREPGLPPSEPLYEGATTAAVTPGNPAVGTFTISAIPDGSYDVALKHCNHLTDLVPDVVVSGSNVTGLEFSLWAGDADGDGLYNAYPDDPEGDNDVDLIDYYTLFYQYHSGLPLTTGYNADFDGDGNIDLDDYYGMYYGYQNAANPGNWYYTYNISGTVTFEYPGWEQTTAPVMYQVREPGVPATEPLYEGTLDIAISPGNPAAGSFTISDIPNGTYDVALKHYNHIADMEGNVVISGADITGLALTLWAGDSDGDDDGTTVYPEDPEGDNDVDEYDYTTCENQNSGALPITTGRNGDFDADGDVDLYDYYGLTYGQPHTPAPWCFP